MPKVQGIDNNDDEDDVAARILKVALTPTIYKEDVRLNITEASKATPSKSSGAGGGSAAPAKKPIAMGGGGQFGKPKMGGGFGGPKKPIGGGVKPKGAGGAPVATSG